MRAKRRSTNSSVLTDREGVAFLDMLNSAVTTVLETRTWDFQRRSDGQIITVPSFSGDVATPIAGIKTLSFGDYNGSDETLFGDFVTRIIILQDPNYGHTSVRVDSGVTVGLTAVTFLEDNWPGTGGTSTWQTITYEYLLPSTVRQVTEVRHQEGDANLLFEASPEDYYRSFPRPQDDLSSRPECVVVGGEITTTATLGSQTHTSGLALMVWPVPSAEYQLDYSYVYRQARLDSESSELVRVPAAVEDVIVDLAVARVILEIEKDVNTGVALERKILGDVERLHRNHEPGAGKRPQMLSHDMARRPVSGLDYLPRSVAGLPTS